MPVVGLFLDPEAMEVPKNFKDLQKLGVRNIAQYSAANVSFPAFFPPTFTSYMLSTMFTGAWPTREAKPRFGAALVRMIVKLTYWTVYLVRESFQSV